MSEDLDISCYRRNCTFTYFVERNTTRKTTPPSMNNDFRDNQLRKENLYKVMGIQCCTTVNRHMIKHVRWPHF